VQGKNIAVAPSGAIVFAYNTAGAAALNRTAYGSWDIIVQAIGPNGDPLWLTSLGSSDDDAVTQLVHRCQSRWRSAWSLTAAARRLCRTRAMCT
jgi:hypothetical protein